MVEKLQDIVVLNVYAPLTSFEKLVVWKELADTLLKDCRWILMGNWNMVEKVQDKSSLEGGILLENEKVSFN